MIFAAGDDGDCGMGGGMGGGCKARGGVEGKGGGWRYGNLR